MSTKKKQAQDKYKEPFKITVNRTSKTKSELSVQEVKPFAPTIPVIDLTPSALIIRYDKEKVIRKFAMMALTVTALFSAVWGVNFAVASIQTNSNTAKLQEIDGLQKQLGAVEGYRVYADGIKLVREDMYAIVKNNVDMGIAIKAIVNSAKSNNVKISNIKITETATSNEPNVCVNSEPFKTTIQVGCINLNGTADNNSSVIKFFDDILNTKGFSDSFINSMGISGTRVVFSGTISMTEALKVKRYDYLSTELISIDKIIGAGGLSDGSLKDILTASNGTAKKSNSSPTPSASPSEAASASTSVTPSCTPNSTNGTVCNN